MSTNYYISGSIMAETRHEYSNRNYAKSKVQRIIQEATESYFRIYDDQTHTVPVDINMYVTDNVVGCTQDDDGMLHDKYGEVVLSLSGTITNTPENVNRVTMFINMIISAFIAHKMIILSGTLYLASSTELKPSVIYTVGVTDEFKRLHPVTKL